MNVPTYYVVQGNLVDTTVPVPNNFRDAWVMEGNVVVTDMEKARVIRKNQLRQEREELFKVLDGQYMMALERSNTKEKSRIASIKQALRDFPDSPLFTEASTPEELEAITLETFIP